MMTALTINFETKPGRACGDCQLCCKLVPVKEIGKKAGQRCKNQRHHKGCAVYRKKGFPMSCHFWTCAWLTGEVGADMRRPDRAHYVVDVMPDYVTASEDDTGETHQIPVVQVWCDPGYPDAHRDPALRTWLDANQAVAIVRFNHEEGLVVFPPSRMQNHQWLEKTSNFLREEAHSFAQVAAVLSGNP
jgi:hypothetical protein